ncbi:tetratricopeptide repeat protein [Bradyrhizobium sp. Arg237L]|uniref:O-linked N-acetylglucosamine transferase, SPINDLY family protein n=1 Tax=Bradyrhizobium sp. Arg237L TaxID=3003352 RepID=UPI00249E1E38|nr:glycosyltransferase family 41 protein [Bradyrhizobium sp. Arg237L]MDI4235728.1 tetratricopeptide repeat protein [Bradyrhizobium sp. Arg237L]
MEDNSGGRLAIRVEHGGHAILARPVPSSSAARSPAINGGERPSANLRRAQELHQQGVAHGQQDRWRQALRAFNEAARLAPDQPAFNYCKGVALCRLDRFDDAREAFMAELRVTPTHAPALTEIGTCLARTGRTRDGIPYLQEGLRLLPNMPLAQYSLGLALLTENRRSEALAALDKAIELDAGYVEAYRTRGLAYVMDGQFDKAVDDLRAASTLDSQNYKAIIELGVNFGLAVRDKQAGRLFELAADSAPTVALPQYMYGQFLINHRQFERGLSYVDRALALDPLQGEHHVARGFGLLGQGRIEDAVAAYRRAGELDPANPGFAGTLLFALQHKPGVTRDELLHAHRRWATLYRPTAPMDRLAFPNTPDPTRKPRLGLVSADMHRHAVSFLVLRAFEALAALGYEICCYKTDSKRQDDDFSERYKEISVSWRDVSGMDGPALGQQILDDRIDILFDLAGHTAGNRLSLFATRAAPIQLGWAGYVGTVGLDTYDGLIADPVEIPPEHDASYIERPIRLPDCYVCYHPPEKAPEVLPLPSANGGRFTFCCFNRPAKLNSEVGKAWARILEQVPDSRILMVYGGLGEASTRDAIYNVLGQGGVPRERVELVGEAEQPKILQAYCDVDLALDPFPYSAGVTTLEAMWMGVPTVTFVGDTFAGRHSAAHLTAAGLGSFCTTSIDDYVAMAVDWTRRRDELADLRSGLRARVAASPLCDAPRFADNLSRELMRLWTEWCEAKTARGAA